MSDDRRGERSQAEARFKKAQQTDHEAKAISDAELQAARRKTACLRAERLAKEAAETKSELDKKPRAREFKGK